MTATLLVVDAGSSSVRLAAFDAGGLDARSLTPPTSPVASAATPELRRIARAHAELPAEQRSIAFNAMLHSFLEQNAISDVRAVAHRIVHGGISLSASCILNATVERTLLALTELAPLHLSVALDWVALCRAIFGPSVPQIAVFDTAFFATLPAVARSYAIPPALQKTHGVRRFGFHGLAHNSMLHRIQRLRPDLSRGGRVISIQLGAGCSIAAIDRGVPQDTSMGFSPLEGLVMATRSGDIDAGLVTYLERAGGFSAESLERLLNKESGLLGLSGLSGDMRTLLASRNPDARFAIELYCYRVRKYIGAYIAVLGGVDVIVFGGGVGEHAPEIRERILAGMEWCGVTLDNERNDAARGTEETDARIGKSTTPVDVWAVAVDEGAVLAREAAAVLRAEGGSNARL
ncbi:MAG TPA: acetate/propionate family kinase [Gemmatimonadaceae bacterium]|nr:acetate/propionate family kinase [Gemmatimonadaceae bacterium]